MACFGHLPFFPSFHVGLPQTSFCTHHYWEVYSLLWLSLFRRDSRSFTRCFSSLFSFVSRTITACWDKASLRTILKFASVKEVFCEISKSEDLLDYQLPTKSPLFSNKSYFISSFFNCTLNSNQKSSLKKY